MFNFLLNCSIMKKQILLMTAAVLTITSCSKDESTEVNNGQAIAFRVAMETRATETTTANITNFLVTAINAGNSNFFTDQAFTKTGSYFTSNPAYYWPNDGSNLSFFAYSPSATDLGATISITSASKTMTNFSPAAAIASQKDFITASATGSKANESTGVALTFAHRLAQIEIKAKNANQGYVYKVQGVRIGQPVSQATTFDFGTSAWTLGTTKSNYEVTYTSAKTLNATAASIMATDGNNAAADCMDARFGQDQHEKRCVYRGEGQYHDHERRPRLSGRFCRGIRLGGRACRNELGSRSEVRLYAGLLERRRSGRSRKARPHRSGSVRAG